MRPMLGIAILALLLRVLILAVRHDAPIDMDGAEYARLAQNLHAGIGYVGMRGMPVVEYPPLYPLLIAALLPFVHDAQFAGTAVSTICGTLLVVGVWLVAAELYDRRVATIAALIVAVLPMATSLSTTVLADAPFEAAVVFGVWFMLRLLHAWRSGDAAACAACFVLAYLARPEGIAFVVLAMVAVALAALRMRRPVQPVLAFLVTTLAITLPYVLYTYQTAGRVVLEGKSAINVALAQGMEHGKPYLAVADALDAHGRPVGPEIDPHYYDPRLAPPLPPLGTRAQLAVVSEVRHAKDVVLTFRSFDYGKGLLFVLAIIGLVQSLRMRRQWPGQAVLLASVALLYAALASVWHFWDRYAAGFIPFAAVWAGFGVVTLEAWCRRRRWPNAGFALAAALVLIAVVFDGRVALADRSAPERVAGAWIAQTVPHANVIDISDLSAYYAGATWSPLPFADERLACRYIAARHPDVLVIDTSRANDYPPLAPWFAAAPTCRQAVLAYRVDRLRVYRWVDRQAAAVERPRVRFVRSTRTDFSSSAPN